MMMLYYGVLEGLLHDPQPDPPAAQLLPPAEDTLPSSDPQPEESKEDVYKRQRLMTAVFKPEKLKSKSEPFTFGFGSL